MKDAYDRLFAKYDKDEFFQDSLDNIIFVPDEKIEANWANQKQKLLNNGELFIRDYGKKGANTHLIITFYRNLFSNDNIRKDSNNNATPTKVLSELTGFCKNAKFDKGQKERIQNYQVSHLFGRTKNPLLFTAAWNIAYIPKYIDPFTGHETQGHYPQQFKKLFEEKIGTRFMKQIIDYNAFIAKHVQPNIESVFASTVRQLGLAEKEAIVFRQNVSYELSPIIF